MRKMRCDWFSDCRQILSGGLWIIEWRCFEQSSLCIIRRNSISATVRNLVEAKGKIVASAGDNFTRSGEGPHISIGRCFSFCKKLYLINKAIKRHYSIYNTFFKLTYIFSVFFINYSSNKYSSKAKKIGRFSIQIFQTFIFLPNCFSCRFYALSFSFRKLRDTFQFRGKCACHCINPPLDPFVLGPSRERGICHQGDGYPCEPQDTSPERSECSLVADADGHVERIVEKRSKCTSDRLPRRQNNEREGQQQDDRERASLFIPRSTSLRHASNLHLMFVCQTTIHALQLP